MARKIGKLTWYRREFHSESIHDSRNGEWRLVYEGLY